MMTALSIISFLCLSFMGASAVDRFPEKFQLGERGDKVILTCPTTKLPVIWMYESSVVENSEFQKVDGNTLLLDDFEEDQTGNYTCWNNENVVDHIYVLLNKSKEIPGPHITCTAETFNCTYNIYCTMSLNGFRDFRLRNERDNSSWVHPSADGVFYLTHSTNPYAEEAQRLVVTGEAVSSSDYYFKTSHSFFLRDIIKPGCPEISVKKRQVTLRPPATWAKPLSYYPLEHEIQCQQRDNGEENICQLDNNMAVPKGISKLRVRCRDSLLLSQWSEWTPWQNVGRKRKIKGKNRKTKDGKKKHPDRKRNKNKPSVQ